MTNEEEQGVRFVETFSDDKTDPDGAVVMRWSSWYPDVECRIHNETCWGDDDMDVVSVSMPADEALGLAAAMELVDRLVVLLDLPDESPLQNFGNVTRVLRSVAEVALERRAERLAS